MIVTQHPSGIEVSDIIDGYLVTELYIDYTIEEAKAKFLNTHGRGGYVYGEALAGVNCQICRVILTEETAATAGINPEWGETCQECIIKLAEEEE